MPAGLPEGVVHDYQRRFPSVEITADSGNTEANIEQLRSGALDVAFLLGPLENTADLAWVEIATEPIIVALPRAHPLSRRRRIRREELARIPLVYFPRHNSPGFYDSSLSQVYGSSPPDIVRLEPNEERMLIAVSEGPGITLLLEARTATLRFPGVVYRRFAEPRPTGALGVAFHQPPPLAARRFIELAQEMARQSKPAKRPRIPST